MIANKWNSVGLWACVLFLATGPASRGQEPTDPVIKPLQERVSQFLEGVSLG